MENKTALKVRKIATYILPFISMAIVSFTIEFIGNIVFDTTNLFTKFLLEIFITVIWSIVFIIVGYYTEPENKRKAIKFLSVILCFMNLLVFFGNQSEFIQPTIGIITTIATYLILYKIEDEKTKEKDI